MKFGFQLSVWTLRWKNLFVWVQVLIAVIMKSSTYWDMPYSLLDVNRRFRGTCRLHVQGRRTSQARDKHEEGNKQNPCFMTVSSSTLKKEAAYSSVTVVDFQRTTRRYIAELGTLQSSIWIRWVGTSAIHMRRTDTGVSGSSLCNTRIQKNNV
jgi:hypothetical protein